MEIKTLSIKDISKQFEILTTSFSNYNYKIKIKSKIFTYKTDSNFDINNLKQIFSEKKSVVAGNIKKSCFEEATSNLEYALSHYETKAGTIEKTLHEDIIYYRKQSFLMIINEHLSKDTPIIYEHIPDQNSYFDFGCIWKFCYIFLNNNKGLVLSAGAFD